MDTQWDQSRSSLCGASYRSFKNEVMHFFRASQWKQWSSDAPNGPILHLNNGEGQDVTVSPQPIMRYLGFFLDCKLSFKAHITQSCNKAMSLLQGLRLLGNSDWGLQPKHKRMLYISNVLPLLFYGLPLWWNDQGHGNQLFFKEMQKVQNVTARWITGCFQTTPVGTLNLLSGLVPMFLQCCKYGRWWGLRVKKLHPRHSVRGQMNECYWTINMLNIEPPFPLSINKKQEAQLTPFTEWDKEGRKTNEIFSPLHNENHPGSYILD